MSMDKLTEEQKSKIIENAIESVRQKRDINFSDVVESLTYAANKLESPASLDSLLRDLRLTAIKVSS